MWLSRVVVVVAAVLVGLLTFATGVHVNAAVCADLVGAGGVGVRVWPTLRASPQTHSKRSLFRLLQVNWEAEELKEGDWVGVFRHDPRPPHLRPPPPTTTTTTTTTQRPSSSSSTTSLHHSSTTSLLHQHHHHYWRMPHPLYWDTPQATRGTVTTNITQPRVQLSVLTKGGCVGFYVGFVRNGVCVAAECLASHPSWLSDNRRLLGLRPLRYLVLPGSHNAGTYSLTDTEDVVSTWVVCQDEDIISQLLYGIRYLDLRVAYYPDTAELLWINHDLVQWRPLVDILNGIRGFISISPDPIILDVHRTPVGFDQPEAVPLLLSLVNTTLGPHLLHNRLGPQITLSQILTLKKQVVFSFLDGNIADRVDWVWPPISQAWANAQLLEDLRTYLDAQMNKRHTLPQLWAAMAHLTPTLWDLLLRSHVGLRGLTDKVSFTITRWLRQRWGNKANIVASDFFRSNDLINVAIRTNLAMVLCRRPERSRYPPGAFRRSAAHRAQLVSHSNNDYTTTTTTVPPLFRRMYNTATTPRNLPPSTYIASVQRTYELTDDLTDEPISQSSDASSEDGHQSSVVNYSSSSDHSYSSHISDLSDHSLSNHMPTSNVGRWGSVNAPSPNPNDRVISPLASMHSHFTSEVFSPDSNFYIPSDQNEDDDLSYQSEDSNPSMIVSTIASDLTSHLGDDDDSESSSPLHFSLDEDSYDFKMINTNVSESSEETSYHDYSPSLIPLHSKDTSLNSQAHESSASNNSNLQLEILVFTSSPSSSEYSDRGHMSDWRQFLNQPALLSHEQENRLNEQISRETLSAIDTQNSLEDSHTDQSINVNQWSSSSESQTDEPVNILNSSANSPLDETVDLNQWSSSLDSQVDELSDVNDTDSPSDLQDESIDKISEVSVTDPSSDLLNDTRGSILDSLDKSQSLDRINVSQAVDRNVLEPLTNLQSEETTHTNITDSEEDLLVRNTPKYLHGGINLDINHLSPTTTTQGSEDSDMLILDSHDDSYISNITNSDHLNSDEDSHGYQVPDNRRAETKTHLQVDEDLIADFLNSLEESQSDSILETTDSNSSTNTRLHESPSIYNISIQVVNARNTNLDSESQSHIFNSTNYQITNPTNTNNPSVQVNSQVTNNTNTDNPNILINSQVTNNNYTDNPSVQDSSNSNGTDTAKVQAEPLAIKDAKQSPGFHDNINSNVSAISLPTVALDDHSTHPGSVDRSPILDETDINSTILTSLSSDEIYMNSTTNVSSVSDISAINSTIDVSSDSRPLISKDIDALSTSTKIFSSEATNINVPFTPPATQSITKNYNSNSSAANINPNDSITKNITLITSSDIISRSTTSSPATFDMTPESLHMADLQRQP